MQKNAAHLLWHYYNLPLFLLLKNRVSCFGSPKVFIPETWNWDRMHKYEWDDDWEHFFFIMWSVSWKSNSCTLNQRRRDLHFDCIPHHTCNEQCLHDWIWCIPLKLLHHVQWHRAKFWLADQPRSNLLPPSVETKVFFFFFFWQTKDEKNTHTYFNSPNLLARTLCQPQISGCGQAEGGVKHYICNNVTLYTYI